MAKPHIALTAPHQPWPVLVHTAPQNPVCSCGRHLEIHQPDPRRPTRLLGTCPRCGDWWLLTLGAPEEPLTAA